MSAKKLKKIAVTIGFKADNTPIKKAFYGRSTAQAKNRAERWLESHGTPEKQADILTLGGWAAPLAERVQEAGRHAHRLYDHL